MPLPWLIGAAVVAAAAAVVKAVSDDAPSSSSRSGESVMRRQERDARIQRERDSLSTRLKNLKHNRLEESRKLLATSAETLAQPPKKAMEVSTPKFEDALLAKLQARSGYARGMSKLLSTPKHSRGVCPQKERSEFLVNLQVLESLYGPLTFGKEEQQTLAAIKESGSRLNKLQKLKQQLEQQG